jgi:hypothetical protein
MQVENLDVWRSLREFFSDFCNRHHFWSFRYRFPILVILLLSIFRLLFLLYFFVAFFEWCFSLLLLGRDCAVRWGLLENAPFVAA